MAQKDNFCSVSAPKKRSFPVDKRVVHNCFRGLRIEIQFEEKARDNPSLQVVLVSVDSLAALKSAYPNYYLDTTEFLREVQKATQSN